MQELIDIQSKLEVEKKRHNKFADFYYRSAEDIFNALKPLLQEYKCFITMNDVIEEHGGNIYIKSTARISNSTGLFIEASAYAKEPKAPKAKMDDSQTTGSASTYARKYALNALLCLDDAKDPDGDKPEKNKKKDEVISDQRKKLLEMTAKDNKLLINILSRYSMPSMGDLTDSMIEETYNAMDQKGLIK